MALAGFPFFPAAVPNGGDIERGGGGRREGERLSYDSAISIPHENRLYTPPLSFLSVSRWFSPSDLLRLVPFPYGHVRL